MSDLENPASSAAQAADAYIAAILAALGSREPLTVLREMPAALRQATAGLTPEQLSTPERPGKWSVRQVVQHLADSELVGGFRCRMILAHDAPLLPGYDQDLWAVRLRYEEADLEAALEMLTVLRQASVRLFERASPADLERVMRHEERGNESLGELIRLYAGHDIVHLRQIARIRRAIGAEGREL